MDVYFIWGVFGCHKQGLLPRRMKAHATRATRDKEKEEKEVKEEGEAGEKRKKNSNKKKRATS